MAHAEVDWATRVRRNESHWKPLTLLTKTCVVSVWLIMQCQKCSLLVDVTTVKLLRVISDVMSGGETVCNIEALPASLSPAYFSSAFVSHTPQTTAAAFLIVALLHVFN